MKRRSGCFMPSMKITLFGWFFTDLSLLMAELRRDPFQRKQWFLAWRVPSNRLSIGHKVISYDYFHYGFVSFGSMVHSCFICLCFCLFSCWTLYLLDFDTLNNIPLTKKKCQNHKIVLFTTIAKLPTKPQIASLELAIPATEKVLV